jgi:hypothetical protein
LFCRSFVDRTFQDQQRFARAAFCAKAKTELFMFSLNVRTSELTKYQDVKPDYENLNPTGVSVASLDMIKKADISEVIQFRICVHKKFPYFMT